MTEKADIQPCNDQTMYFSSEREGCMSGSNLEWDPVQSELADLFGNAHLVDEAVPWIFSGTIICRQGESVSYATRRDHLGCELIIVAGGLAWNVPTCFEANSILAKWSSEIPGISVFPLYPAESDRFAAISLTAHPWEGLATPGPASGRAKQLISSIFSSPVDVGNEFRALAGAEALTFEHLGIFMGL
jgi:hypothetical protein